MQNTLIISSNYNNKIFPNNMSNEKENNRNDVFDENENINNKIFNLENKINQILSQELPTIKENLKIINDKIKNYDINLSEIYDIKNEIQNIDKKLKKNNYMIIISNLESQIKEIKTDINKYHPENEKNKIVNNFEFEQMNKIKIDNENNDIIDSDKEIISEKDYNNKIKNDNQDMIDIMASENFKLNPTETFVTMALSKNSLNLGNNNENNTYKNVNKNLYQNININNNDNNNINIKNESERNINNNNELISDNKPIGKAPVPTDKEISDESKNSLDDFEIEEI